MRKCDLATGAGRVRYALEDLETAWNQISDEWNDSVSRRFREHHLDPIVPHVKLALDAIGRMDLLMDEVERDCDA
jgi:hypothetical protein